MDAHPKIKGKKATCRDVNNAVLETGSIQKREVIKKTNPETNGTQNDRFQKRRRRNKDLAFMGGPDT